MPMRFHLLAAAMAAVIATPAAATNSPIELRTALADIMAELSGEFDSEPQRFFEEEYKTPKELVHGRVYRSFTPIEAPDIGPNVLVATARYGGDDGQIDHGEFLVWKLAVDAKAGVVRMTPRRFKEPDKYLPLAKDAARLKGLKAAELAAAEKPAKCEILWRLDGAQYRGESAPGCASMSTTTKTELSWAWSWTLTPDELWLSFAGRDAAGKLVAGRPDQVPWRLGKARPFECFLSFREAGVPDQVNNGFLMHDRGDHYRWQITDAKGTRPVFMELIRGMWPSNSGRNYTDLLRLQVYQGTPDDPPEKWTLIGSALGSAETDRVGFASRGLSGRCKLFDPANPPPKAQ